MNVSPEVVETIKQAAIVLGAASPGLETVKLSTKESAPTKLELVW
ncbi:MAG: hypothetical protein R2880_16310 [Deinococcales bacterium]